MISIEKKGKNQIIVENFTCFILFANKNTVIFTNDERRYFLPDSLSEKKKIKNILLNYMKFLMILKLVKHFILIV